MYDRVQESPASDPTISRELVPVIASRHPHVPPPRSLTWLIEALGVDDTLTLIEKCGGTPVWIPSGVNNSSVKARVDLEAQFGKPMARALIRAFGGVKLTVPIARGWRICLYHAHGMSNTEIALKLVCHYDSVLRRLSRIPGSTVSSTSRAYFAGARPVRGASGARQGAKHD